jgi:ABC-type Na+ efflux pump permease subunit
MNQDAEPLRLLSIFHYVCAGMAAILAFIPIIHLIIGLVLVLRPEVFGPGENQPPPVIGWFFVIFASAFIVAGWTYAALLACAGRCLGRRRHYTFCPIVAAAACLFMPFGTVPGVFALIVLLRPSVKDLFHQPTGIA